MVDAPSFKDSIDRKEKAISASNERTDTGFASSGSEEEESTLTLLQKLESALGQEYT